MQVAEEKTLFVLAEWIDRVVKANPPPEAAVRG
jgi:hypothetical protein